MATAPSPESAELARAPVPTGAGLTLEQVWTLLPPMLLLAYSMRTSISPQDFWWHLQTGSIILETGSIPQVDLFSFTRSGEPWVNQAWGMQVVLYLVHHASGVAGTIFFHSLLICSGYLILGITLSRRYGWLGAWSGIVAAFTAGMIHHGVRPQSVSFLLFGSLCALVELHRAGRTAPLRCAPALFALWTNLHGGFVFGLGALGLYVFGNLWNWVRDGRDPARVRELVELLAISLACTLALALNPEGPLGIVRYVWGFFASDVTVAGNLEFQPLSIRLTDGFFFGLCLVFLSLAIRSGARLTIDQTLSLILFGIASLYIRRIVPWFGFLLAPVLASAIAARYSPSDYARHHRSGRAVGYLVIGLVGLIASLPWLRPYVPLTSPYLIEQDSPEVAIRVLCDHTREGAHVLAAQDFASYQIFHCPGRRIFIDSRLELYPGEIWDDYFALEQGRFDWERLADRYDVEWMLLRAPRSEAGADGPLGSSTRDDGGAGSGSDPARDAPAPDARGSHRRTLVDAARESPRWNEVHRDPTAVIFERVDATQRTPHD